MNSLIAFVVGGIGLWLWRRGMKPAANRIPDGASLARALRLLLSRGVYANGVAGTLTLSLAKAPERRLVYTKYIDGAGPGFRAALPKEPWVDACLGAFEAELTRRGVPFRAGDATAALVFEFKQDFGGAYMVARLLFEDTMGARINRDCVAYFRDVVNFNTPSLTGVDAPDEGWG